MEHKNTPQLCMLGAGGHAKVVLDIARLSYCHDSIFLYDDAYHSEKPMSILSTTVVGNFEILLTNLQKNTNAVFVIAIGNNAIRAKHFSFLTASHATAASVLWHPSSVIAETAKVGKGSVVMANAVVNPETHIGNNVIINTAAIIEHDCVIGDHAHISPNATLCGESCVGEGSWIGAGSVIIEGKHVGKNCIIGAGSVVTIDIPDNTLALGVPAKIIKKTVEII